MGRQLLQTLNFYLSIASITTSDSYNYSIIFSFVSVMPSKRLVLDNNEQSEELRPRARTVQDDDGGGCELFLSSGRRE
jgi:hypothetical protein